jgi:hypothetical protein
MFDERVYGIIKVYVVDLYPAAEGKQIENLKLNEGF